VQVAWWDQAVTALVGRSAEVERFEELVGGLGRDGIPSLLDIAGEPGIGKSRLLAALCAHARRRGLTVLRGRATEYERFTPFQGFLDAFADSGLDHASPDADPLLSRAAPVLFGIDGDRDPATRAGTFNRLSLYSAVAAVLTRLGGERGLVVALDDVHWADPASLELLDHLIRHPVRGRVLFVLARRARQTPTSLTAALTRGVDTGAVAAMPLGPLAEAEFLSALASDLAPEAARRLYAVGEGNPLYLTSLLHAYRNGASPGGSDGAPTRWDPLAGIPDGLRSLLLDELTGLAEPQLAVVRAVTVLGDHATSRMLRRIPGMPADEEFEDCILELTRRDLLRSAGNGRWTLRHPLLRSLVYESTVEHVRAAVHRAAARELTRVGAPVTERAHHIERSLDGWDPDAASVLVEAADRFLDTAPATAAHLLDVVLRLMPDTPAQAGRRGTLTLARARALGFGGDLRTGRALLHTLIGSPAGADAALRADAIALCATMEMHLGHSPEATALLRRELSGSPAPSPKQAIALGRALGMSGLLTGTYPEVRADVAGTVAVAREHRDVLGEAAILAVASLGEICEGEVATACRFAEAAARLLDGLADPDLTGPCDSLVWLAWTEALLDRYAAAERHNDRALEIARAGGRLDVLVQLLTNRAFVQMTTFRLSSALRSAEEAESIARGIGSPDLLAFTLSFKALVLLLKNPFDTSAAILAGEDAVAASADGSSDWWTSLAWGALGIVLSRSGDPHRAREAILTAGGGPLLRRIQSATRPAHFEALVHTALATGDVDDAERWAKQAAGEADRLALPNQRAAAFRALALLAQHRGDAHTALCLLEGAAAEHADSGATTREAYTLFQAVPIATALGEHQRAAAARLRAMRLAASAADTTGEDADADADADTDTDTDTDADRNATVQALSAAEAGAVARAAVNANAGSGPGLGLGSGLSSGSGSGLGSGSSSGSANGAREPADPTARGAAEVTAHLAAAVPEIPRALAQLTPRERQIAGLVAQGLGNQVIASKLRVSRRTVEAHLSTIYRKCTVSSRAALAALVLRAASEASNTG
jgi:DNA-binding CsgD family transcriptional regulator/tetratricopeptide (TPR) repeat protein